MVLVAAADAIVALGADPPTMRRLSGWATAWAMTLERVEESDDDHQSWVDLSSVAIEAPLLLKVHRPARFG